MPVKLGGGESEEEEARIEIVPLIDIMFFLLASFMMVSLQMTRLKTVKVDLPVSSQSAKEQAKNEPVCIGIDKSGILSLDGKVVASTEITEELKQLAADKTLKVIIAADQNTSHRFVMKALDAAREAGIGSIAFATKED